MQPTTTLHTLHGNRGRRARHRSRARCGTVRNIPKCAERSIHRSEMTTFLQCNLGREWTTQALLHQFIYENSIDICIISEQYANLPRASWLSDTSNTAAIWVVSPTLHSMNSGHSDGFIWVKFRDFTLISCYLSPNQGILAFKRQLADLEETIRLIGGEVIVAGDFNAKSTEWEWSEVTPEGTSWQAWPHDST